MSLPRLKDYRGETVDMSCRRCDRHGVFDRKSLVKKFGAQAEFVHIRRVLAIGCDDAGTDRCEAMFPCLLAANVLIE